MTAIKEKFLLARIRMFKDEKAFTQIHHFYYQRVYRFLRMKLPTQHDAEDAVNTTFLHLWNYLRSSDIESLSGLIFTIARASVAEFYRQRKMNLSLDDFTGNEGADNQMLLGDQGAEQTHIVASAEVALIKESIKKLNEEEQKLIFWRYFESQSIKQIAKRIQKSETATRSAVHRAFHKLKDSLPTDQT